MIAKLWAQQIECGKKTFSQVPKKLKASVREILEEDGLGELATE